MSEHLRFQDPVWLILLIPIALLIYWGERRRRRYAVLYSSLDGLRSLPVTFLQRVKRLMPFLRFLGLALIVMSLARPQEGREEFRIRTEGIAIELVLDRSGSMEALDFFEDGGERTDRLSVVKRVVHDFISGDGELEGRPDDLIGLVAFGGFAEGKCPLTLDHGALLQILSTIETPQPIKDARGRVIDKEFYEEERATAVGDALALGVSRVEKVDAKSKVVILLSDGESNAGVIAPLEAAEAARTFGIKVYTIGVGSTGMAPVWGTDPFGRRVMVQQPVRLDEETLKAIADKTGGEYFNARDTETLEEVYGIIDQMEKTETEGSLYTEYRELFSSLLLPGIGLLLLELLLSSTRFRTLP